MIAEERANYILKRLQERETLSLKDIARELSVSEATVRRDFQKLETLGRLVRVHSGALRAEGEHQQHENGLQDQQKDAGQQGKDQPGEPAGDLRQHEVSIS